MQKAQVSYTNNLHSVTLQMTIDHHGNIFHQIHYSFLGSTQEISNGNHLPTVLSAWTEITAIVALTTEELKSIYNELIDASHEALNPDLFSTDIIQDVIQDDIQTTAYPSDYDGPQGDEEDPELMDVVDGTYCLECNAPAQESCKHH